MPTSVVIGAVLTAGIAGAAYAAGVLTAASLGAALLYGATVGGVTAGLQYLQARALRRQSGSDSADIAGAGVTLRRAASQPAPFVVGRARVSGLLAFYGEREEVPVNEERSSDAHLVIALSEGRMDGIERVWVDELEFAVVGMVGAADAAAKRAGIGGMQHYLRLDVNDARGVQLKLYDEHPELLPRARQILQSPVPGRHNAPVQIYPALDPDAGIRPYAAQRLRNLFPGRWTRAHRLTDKAWVYVSLWQPPYSRDPDNQDAPRLWSGLPNLQFLVRGSVITLPWATGAIPAGPHWTRNAAAIRYWFMRHRMGLPEAIFDAPSWRAAWAICEQQVTTPLPDDPAYSEWSETDIRYAADGVIHSGDAVESVLAELDFAWQGYAVDSNGLIHARPGVDHLPVADIGEADIVSRGEIRPAPSLRDRVSTVTMSIAQSLSHGWGGLALPPVTNPAAVARDGRALQMDIGTRMFVANPTQALRAMATVLRRAEQSMEYSYRIGPGEDFDFLGLIPTDIVTMTDTKYGLNATRMEVLGVEVNEDWTVTVQVSPRHHDSIYLDRIDLPAQSLVPPLVLPAPFTPPATPSDIKIERRDTLWSGAAWEAQVVVLATTLAEQVVYHLVSENGAYDHAWTEHARVPYVFRPTAFDVDYVLEARALNPRSGLVSGPLRRELHVSSEGTEPPAPVLVRIDQIGNLIQMEFHPTPDYPDVRGYEVRATLREVGAAEPPGIITDATWSRTGRTLGAVGAAPGAGEGNLVLVTAPVTGQIRLFVRAVNSLGRAGPLTDTGVFVFIRDDSGARFEQEWPAWNGRRHLLGLWTEEPPGAYENMLITDRTTTALLPEVWEGETGWMFGPLHESPTPDQYDPAQSAYYETLEREFEQDEDVYVYYAVETYSPPDVESPPGVRYGMRVDFLYRALDADTDTVVDVTDRQGYEIRGVARYKLRIWVQTMQNIAITRFSHTVVPKRET